MKKEQAQKTLLMIANLAQRNNGNGFRQYTMKKNGGAKNRNNSTWVDKLSRQVEPYFGDGKNADKYIKEDTETTK